MIYDYNHVCHEVYCTPNRFIFEPGIYDFLCAMNFLHWLTLRDLFVAPRYRRCADSYGVIGNDQTEDGHR